MFFFLEDNGGYALVFGAVAIFFYCVYTPIKWIYEKIKERKLKGRN